MDNPLISVIIPIYRVEKYLQKCVYSVVNQTYRNLEIILVDDGSPDGCPQMCDKWASEDCRIRVIHKKNEGISDARNTGLDVCKGEYICFVDSDDWIAMDMVEVLIKTCQKNKVNMAVCGRYDVYEQQGIPVRGKVPSQDCVIDTKTAVANMFQGKDFDCSPAARIFHRSLWENIRFPSGKIFEDIAILYKVVLASDSVALVKEPLYFYLRRSDGITGSGFRDALYDYPFNTRNLLKDIQKNYEDLFDYACWVHTKALEFVLARIAKANKKTFRENMFTFKKLSNELFSYRHIWLHSKVFTKKEVLYCLFYSHWYLIRPGLYIKGLRKK